MSVKIDRLSNTILEVLSKTSAKLSELCADIPKYFASEEMKIASTETKKFEVAEKVKQEV